MHLSNNDCSVLRVKSVENEKCGICIFFLCFLFVFVFAQTTKTYVCVCVCSNNKDKYIVSLQVREWREFEHLTELPCLEVLIVLIPHF